MKLIIQGKSSANSTLSFVLSITIGILFCLLILCVISWFVFCSKYKQKNKNFQLSLQRIQSANSALSKSKSVGIGGNSKLKKVQLTRFATQGPNIETTMRNASNNYKNDKNGRIDNAIDIGDAIGYDAGHIDTYTGATATANDNQEYEDEDEGEQENVIIFNDAGEGQETIQGTTNY